MWVNVTCKYDRKLVLNKKYFTCVSELKAEFRETENVTGCCFKFILWLIKLTQTFIMCSVVLLLEKNQKSQGPQIPQLVFFWYMCLCSVYLLINSCDLTVVRWIMKFGVKKSRIKWCLFLSQGAGCPPLVLQTLRLTLLISELSTSLRRRPTLSHTTGKIHLSSRTAEGFNFMFYCLLLCT